MVSEEDWENLICKNPEAWLGEPMTLVSRQVKIEGGRIDVILRDANDKLVIVEIQLGTLDPSHFGRTIFYRAQYAEENPRPEDIRAVVICNKVHPKIIKVCDQLGIECKTFSQFEMLEAFVDSDPRLGFASLSYLKNEPYFHEDAHVKRLLENSESTQWRGSDLLLYVMKEQSICSSFALNSSFSKITTDQLSRLHVLCNLASLNLSILLAPSFKFVPKDYIEEATESSTLITLRKGIARYAANSRLNLDLLKADLDLLRTISIYVGDYPALEPIVPVKDYRLQVKEGMAEVTLEKNSRGLELLIALCNAGTQADPVGYLTRFIIHGRPLSQIADRSLNLAVRFFPFLDKSFRKISSVLDRVESGPMPIILHQPVENPRKKRGHWDKYWYYRRSR